LIESLVYFFIPLPPKFSLIKGDGKLGLTRNTKRTATHLVIKSKHRYHVSLLLQAKGNPSLFLQATETGETDNTNVPVL
jgi:hypothetical protein